MPILRLSLISEALVEQVKFQPRAGGFGSQPRTGEKNTESAEEESAEKESAERVRRRI